MIFKERYQALYTQVQPQESLLQTTKDKMKAAAVKSKKPERVWKIAAAVCLVVTVSLVALPKLLNPSPPAANKTFANFATANIISATSSNSQNSIYINELGELNKKPLATSGTAISKTEIWSIEKYADYLGIDPRNAMIPQGLLFVEQSSRKMAYSGDKLCSMYNTWDFQYKADKDDAHAKEINIYTNKDFIPYNSAPRAYQPTAYNEKAPGKSIENQLKMGKQSTINRTKVTIWHKASGLGYKCGWNGGNYQFKDYYCADFRYKNVGFTVTAENGVTKQEFLTLISSIIK